MSFNTEMSVDGAAFVSKCSKAVSPLVLSKLPTSRKVRRAEEYTQVAETGIAFAIGWVEELEL